MHKTKEWIENNPGLSMIILSFAGLAYPYGKAFPDALVIGILATLIFLSCFRINVPLQSVLSWRPFFFWLLRFVLAPVLLWAVCVRVAPDYALGVLVLGLVPAGASSAALTGIYNGNVAMALIITIISSIGSVFLIPSVVSLLNDMNVSVPATSILKTLVLCVLFPGAIYLLVKKQPRFQRYNKNYGRLTSVVLISVLAFIGLSKKREFFLVHPQEMIAPFLVAIAFFAFAIAIGFLIKASKENRIANGVCSAFNNTSLGVGLSLLYFDEKTVAVLIAALFLWSFLPLFVQPLIKRI